jgi:uncharacterized protein (DUF2164 family)
MTDFECDREVRPDMNAKLCVEASRLKIELSKEARSDAITSIQRYFQENMPEPIGNMAAGLLLNYFVEEVGPAIYNQAIADAQARIQQRLSDIEGELYAPEFQYWPNIDRKRKKQG